MEDKLKQYLRNSLEVSIKPEHKGLFEDFLYYVHATTNNYIKLKDQEKWGESESPIAFFHIIQIKYKFDRLTIYYNLERVEHDWEVFDKEWFDENFIRMVGQIAGYCSAICNMANKN